MALVALDGDRALIGARQKLIEGLPSHGAAYIYARSAGNWSEVQRLLPSNGQEGGEFGSGAALDGDLALVYGAADIRAGFEAGIVYEYRSDGTAWVEIQQIRPPDGNSFDRFGQHIALGAGAAVFSNTGNTQFLPLGGMAWILARPTLFADGFESGDTSAWSQTVP